MSPSAGTQNVGRHEGVRKKNSPPNLSRGTTAHHHAVVPRETDRAREDSSDNAYTGGGKRTFAAARPNVHQINRAPCRGRDPALFRQRRRQLRQRPGCDDLRPVHGRGHPPPRSEAQLRGRRIRDAAMRRLVRQPPLVRAHREHPAGRN